jgi:ubiquinol-cytochrome c reductase cytochrome c subunit
VRRRLLGLVCMCGLLLAACSYFGRDPEPYRPPAVARAALPSDGRGLFLRDCAWCHGDQAQGSPRGPSLQLSGPAAVDFMLSTGRMPLFSPDDPLRRRDPTYDEREIRQIVNYLATIAPEGPPIPELDLESVDLSRGAVLYSENCAACHSSTGIGGALTEGRTAPALDESTPIQTAEAIRTGPGTMPPFDAQTLGQDELAAVAAYVDYLQDPEDAGGEPLGHVGPVSEGLIAWAVGLLALILVIRWIGVSVK